MICVEEGLIATALVFLLMLFSVATSIVAYFFLPAIEAHLQRSKGLLDMVAFLKNGGIFGKSSICGIISVVFLMPSIFARRGYIDIDEFKRFPRSLKLKLIIPWYGLYMISFVTSCFWYTMDSRT